MSPTPTPELAKPATDDGDSLDHIMCCVSDEALCGADLSRTVEVTSYDELDHPCRVCDDLAESPGCPRSVLGLTLMCWQQEQIARIAPRQGSAGSTP